MQELSRGPWGRVAAREAADVNGTRTPQALNALLRCCLLVCRPWSLLWTDGHSLGPMAIHYGLSIPSSQLTTG